MTQDGDYHIEIGKSNGDTYLRLNFDSYEKLTKASAIVARLFELCGSFEKFQEVTLRAFAKEAHRRVQETEA